MHDIDPLYRDFGDRLASARRRLRWSQAQLAAKLGLSRTSITNIECGRQAVQLHVVYQIAELLQILPSELLPPAKGDSKNVSNLKVEAWLAQISREEKSNNDAQSFRANPADFETR